MLDRMPVSDRGQGQLVIGVMDDAQNPGICCAVDGGKLNYARQVTAKTTSDRLDYRVPVSTMRDGPSRRYLESRPAQGRSVGADHETYSNRCRSPGCAELSVYIENVNPVARTGGVIVEEPPGSVRLLAQFWSTEERLPRIPYGLGQCQRAPDGRLSLGYLKLKGDLIESTF